MGAGTGFGERLLAASERHGRLCVGIDPHASLLQAWGLDDDVAGLTEFTSRCVEAFAGQVALVKPQVAFFERFGSAGFAVLERALADLRESGTLVVADAKRGDIGSTMAGYADAWLGERSPLSTDAVTVSPYLGVGALQPVFDYAASTGAGVFVLAATSNPEAVELQAHADAKGRSVAQHVVDACAALNAAARAQGVAGSVGNIGVVVGATLAAPPELDGLGGPVLMPGVGAQGATRADVDRIAGSALGIPNVSRSVLSAGPDIADLRRAAIGAAGDYPVGR
ncbi:orotidine-5'-phosphate decarboxylase [Corynebacterium guangdongense]|uniref:Orotidine 5'-phosphate decarboxylase n=1 Tax=Corynebacterium guangdongense TaxID=1783348 RepID=A0ABU1ZWV2_9CORY|nr:orotidine-5'-phosphate decarboxylase [Corynebacterium guangdongense]MDR7329417.1 orotidine-5'-phosphate decarboxylase [Corynebacterium guangdongense]WJZ17982.1 orotidine 5'-phosphate decarboxylase [Corynebacterium guangdongense]